MLVTLLESYSEIHQKVNAGPTLWLILSTTIILYLVGMKIMHVGVVGLGRMGGFHASTLPQPNRDHPLIRWRKERGLGNPVDMPRDYFEWIDAEDSQLNRY